MNWLMPGSRPFSTNRPAVWYRLDVGTVRNWEQGRSELDRTSRAMLWMITVNPTAVRHALDQDCVTG